MHLSSLPSPFLFFHQLPNSNLTNQKSPTKMTKMLFLTTLPIILLSACALAAPPFDRPDPEIKLPVNYKEFLEFKHTLEKMPPMVAPLEYEPNLNFHPVNETEQALRPKTTCTYQVNYKMNTYYLFGDNWNVTKDELKTNCEKGRSRVLNHWSYREWYDDNGKHFCAKVSFFFFSCLMQWIDGG
jgi:hypothetical protein